MNPAKYPARAVFRQSCLPVDPAEYPARAARQWIAPSTLPERLAGRFRRVSHQQPASGSRRESALQWIPPQWIPPSIRGSRQVSLSIPPQQPAGRSRRVSRWVTQTSSPVDPAEYPARVARQSSSPAEPAEYLTEQPASGSRRVPRQVSQSSSAVDPAEYPAECPLPVGPAEYPASCSPAFASGSRKYPARAARQSGLLNPRGAQLGLHFMLVPSCVECTLRLGKGDAFVLLWVAKKQLRLTPRRVSFWKGLGFC